MAREEDLEVTDAWQEMTDADASALTFLNNGPFPIRVQYGADSTLPAATDGTGDRYGGSQGERDITPPGVRAFVRAPGGRAVVGVRTVDV